MNYYKIFKDTICMGVINSNNFKFINPQTKCTIIVPENQATCIEYNHKYYCTVYMPTTRMGDVPYEYVDIISINKDQYNEFLELQMSGEEQQIIQPEMILIPTQTESQAESTQLQPKMTIQQMRDKIIEQEQQIQLLTNYILELN